MNKRDDDLFKMAAGQPGRFSPAPTGKPPEGGKRAPMEGGTPRPVTRPEATGRNHVNRQTIKPQG